MIDLTLTDGQVAAVVFLGFIVTGLLVILFVWRVSGGDDL